MLLSEGIFSFISISEGQTQVLSAKHCPYIVDMSSVEHIWIFIQMLVQIHLMKNRSTVRLNRNNSNQQIVARTASQTK